MVYLFIILLINRLFSNFYVTQQWYSGHLRLMSRQNVSMWNDEQHLLMSSQLIWHTSKLLNKLSFILKSFCIGLLFRKLSPYKSVFKKNFSPFCKELWIFNLLFIKTSFIFIKWLTKSQLKCYYWVSQTQSIFWMYWTTLTFMKDHILINTREIQIFLNVCHCMAKF